MKKAFTLIELLVVVLIIGILAAIALPQYEKAVERSRASEAELVLRSLRDAQARCILQNGDSDFCLGEDSDDNLFTAMDLGLPFPPAEDAEDVLGLSFCLKSKDFYYCLEGSYLIVAYRIKGGRYPYNLSTSAFSDVPQYNRIVCGQEETNACINIGYNKEQDYGWVKP